jgi:hypothetical protein
MGKLLRSIKFSHGHTLLGISFDQEPVLRTKTITPR